MVKYMCLPPTFAKKKLQCLQILVYLFIIFFYYTLLCQDAIFLNPPRICWFKTPQNDDVTYLVRELKGHYLDIKGGNWKKYITRNKQKIANIIGI
jgi:hypothetical protein